MWLGGTRSEQLCWCSGAAGGAACCLMSTEGVSELSLQGDALGC